MERTSFSPTRYVLEMFSSEAYLVVNKKLLQKFGPEIAIYIANLIDKYRYFLKRDALKNGGFFLSQEEQSVMLGMSVHKLRSCKRFLIEQEMLKTKLLGMPSKEYYYMDFNMIMCLVLSENIQVLNSLRPRSQEIAPLGIEEFNTLQFNKKQRKEEQTQRVCPHTHVHDTHSTQPEEDSFYPEETPVQITHFEEFWNLYPKKSDKGAAETAWTSLCRISARKRPTWRKVQTALHLQKKSELWADMIQRKDFQYMPRASKWIREKGWLNDADEMKLRKSNGQQLTIGYRSPGYEYKKPAIVM